MANPLFDRYLTRTRQRIGMTVDPRRGRGASACRVRCATGRAVAFLVDQGAVGLASTWVPFFGRLAKTPRGPAVFALAARRADRVRRRAAPAVGAVSSDLRADRVVETRATARPTSTASSPTTRACSSVGCGARRSNTSGIIGAGSTSGRARRPSSEIRYESGDGSSRLGSSARGSASA